MSSDIMKNIDEIEKKISGAALRAGRDRRDILLLAVSKTKPVELIRKAVDCGLTELGENKVQEIMEKYEPMGEKVSWHLIGHLQTNKVKYIIDKVKLIHSVDSVKLAQEINKRAHAAGRVQDVLVEVNAAGEESKFGIRPEETEGFIRELSELKAIRVCGLMTVAPFVENPEDNRPVFRGLKKLLIDINEKKINNINMFHLSMGMSNDYEVAIEEGSTIVRIGTSIFGARDYRV